MMVVSHKHNVELCENTGHLLASLEICQTNSIYVYIGIYCLEMNAYVGKSGEKGRIFFLSNGCVGIQYVTLLCFLDLAEIDYQLVGKREAFLKYIS